MSKSPVVNALLAATYIAFVSLVLYAGTVMKLGHNSLFAPIIFISLFTFSAASMGYIFLYQPFVLYFDGKKKQALELFLHTLFIFGGLIFILFIALCYTSVR